MAKIYGFHDVTLREGVTGEQVEKFFKEEVAAAPFIEGWEGYLLRKLAGPRGDEYIWVDVIEEERWDNTHPEVGEELAQWLEDHADLASRWNELIFFKGVERWVADYVIVGKFG